jgi:hypothetical protein
MEAVAAASAIAGIVSLAGQILTATISLKSFFQDVKDADNFVQTFLREVSSLIQVLQEVQDVCGRISNVLAIGILETAIKPLKLILEDCSNDIHKWLVIARKLPFTFSGSINGLYKKFLVAVNKGRTSTMQYRLQLHFRHITCILQVIGRYVDKEGKRCRLYSV